MDRRSTRPLPPAPSPGRRGGGPDGVGIGGEVLDVEVQQFAGSGMLDLEPGVSKEELREAAGNGILAETVLVGTNER